MIGGSVEDLAAARAAMQAAAAAAAAAEVLPAAAAAPRVLSSSPSLAPIDEAETNEVCARIVHHEFFNSLVASRLKRSCRPWRWCVQPRA